MAALGQFYASSMSALGQFYVGSILVICQSSMAALSDRSVVCQFYVRGYAPSATPVWRGRLSARPAGSSLPPSPAEKTRTRTSSGGDGGYLEAVRWEVSGSGSSRRMCSMGTPALEGIIDEKTATEIGGAKAHGPNIG